MKLKPTTKAWCRAVAAVPLVATLLASAPPAVPALASTSTSLGCQLMGPQGGPSRIRHVVHIQFDNVHFTRDNPNVPSDLEQMPHLLNFLENNGTVLANEHTPLIAHTADDLLTGLTGVYGDQHGIPVSNSFEYYNNSSVGSYNTSAFTYWTDHVAPDPADPIRALPFQMIDSAGKNLQAPWVPFVKAGCNFGAVSTVNMVLENNGNDVSQVFGTGSPEAGESSSARTNDFVGIAVHCADTTCSTVGDGVPTGGSHARSELGGQGVAALYGHKYVASQVSSINQINGTPITGFNQASGFNPTADYTLGYLTSLLQANVPVVYGYIADVHDSGNSCAATTASSPTVSDTNNGRPCGAYAPGEAGYVQNLRDYDASFAGWFARLQTLGIDQSNTLFVFHADENDHYAGSAPLNPGCDGVNVACTYDRTQLGEVTTDLPLLLQQQQLYDFGMSGGTGSTPGTPRSGFTNTDQPYAIDFDTAPGFWLKGHPDNGSAPLRKLEGALAKVTALNPYLGPGTSEPLFRFLIDAPGLKALHMITGDPNRTPGVIGFGAEDHFISTFSLLNTSGAIPTSSCNVFPSSTDATCRSNGFIWLHGNYAADVDNTWAALAGPGVKHRHVDSSTWADHTDLRPTMMTLLCLSDSYTHEGRALLEDLDDSALPRSVVRHRGGLTELGEIFKQLNAPVGAFGRYAIAASTRAIKSSDARYAQLENQLQEQVNLRDRLSGPIAAELDRVTSCGSPAADGGNEGLASGDGRSAVLDFDDNHLNSLKNQAREMVGRADQRRHEVEDR